jgi:hypothetical protein
MKKLIYLALVTSIFCACNKDCERYNETRNVNVSDLPAVIPYSDSSTVKFIKNGTDTLTYTSQGLKETYTDSYESNTRSGGCGTNLKLQQYSLKMKHSDDEFFEIIDYSKYNASDNISVNINNRVKFTQLYAQNYYSYGNAIVIDTITINNCKYEKISKVYVDVNNYFLGTGKIGIIKMVVNGNTYELVK